MRRVFSVAKRLVCFAVASAMMLTSVSTGVLTGIATSMRREPVSIKAESSPAAGFMESMDFYRVMTELGATKRFGLDYAFTGTSEVRANALEDVTDGGVGDLDTFSQGLLSAVMSNGVASQDKAISNAFPGMMNTDAGKEIVNCFAIDCLTNYKLSDKTKTNIKQLYSNAYQKGVIKGLEKAANILKEICKGFEGLDCDYGETELKNIFSYAGKTFDSLVSLSDLTELSVPEQLPELTTLVKDTLDYSKFIKAVLPAGEDISNSIVSGDIGILIPDQSITEGQMRVAFFSKKNNIQSPSEQAVPRVPKTPIKLIYSYNKLRSAIDEEDFVADNPLYVVADGRHYPTGRDMIYDNWGPSADADIKLGEAIAALPSRFNQEEAKQLMMIETYLGDVAKFAARNEKIASDAKFVLFYFTLSDYFAYGDAEAFKKFKTIITQFDMIEAIADMVLPNNGSSELDDKWLKEHSASLYDNSKEFFEQAAKLLSNISGGSVKFEPKGVKPAGDVGGKTITFFSWDAPINDENISVFITLFDSIYLAMLKSVNKDDNIQIAPGEKLVAPWDCTDDQLKALFFWLFFWDPEGEIYKAVTKTATGQLSVNLTPKSLISYLTPSSDVNMDMQSCQTCATHKAIDSNKMVKPKKKWLMGNPLDVYCDAMRHLNEEHDLNPNSNGGKTEWEKKGFYNDILYRLLAENEIDGKKVVGEGKTIPQWISSFIDFATFNGWGATEEAELEARKMLSEFNRVLTELEVSPEVYSKPLKKDKKHVRAIVGIDAEEATWFTDKSTTRKAIQEYFTKLISAICTYHGTATKPENGSGLTETIGFMTLYSQEAMSQRIEGSLGNAKKIVDFFEDEGSKPKPGISNYFTGMEGKALDYEPYDVVAIGGNKEAGKLYAVKNKEVLSSKKVLTLNYAMIKEVMGLHKTGLDNVLCKKSKEMNTTASSLPDMPGAPDPNIMLGFDGYLQGKVTMPETNPWDAGTTANYASKMLSHYVVCHLGLESEIPEVPANPNDPNGSGGKPDKDEDYVPDNGEVTPDTMRKYRPEFFVDLSGEKIIDTPQGVANREISDAVRQDKTVTFLGSLLQTVNWLVGELLLLMAGIYLTLYILTRTLDMIPRSWLMVMSFGRIDAYEIKVSKFFVLVLALISIGILFLTGYVYEASTYVIAWILEKINFT